MIAKYKAETDDQLLNQDNKLEITAKYNDQLKLQIEEAKSSMATRWDKSVDEILVALKVQEIRMQ